MPIHYLTQYGSIYCQWNHLEYISLKSKLKKMYSFTNGVSEMTPIVHSRCHHCGIYHHETNGNFFRITGPVRWELTGHRRILLTKDSDAELVFPGAVPEQTVGANHQDAGDLKYHRAHNDVTLMITVTHSVCMRKIDTFCVDAPLTFIAFPTAGMLDQIYIL